MSDNEQLIELMLQLKKTTPAAAKQILNSQPRIAYALMTLMVSMNAVNFEVFQVCTCSVCSIAAAPAPTMHGHYRPASTPTQPTQPYNYSAIQQPLPSSGYSSQVPAINPAVLAAIPDDQRAMVMQVLSMTPEQINMLPPQNRASIMELRATLGL
ncbi:hypothetical protein BDP27DRAFT_1313530 [Rhodocollybia butyracea]|uniref:Cleavage stimulation factor subunit 2 hinge domain-containing protein n=1 Tax=Rhodocollybia butyracea TaxID=206335 RepID=A0A9P5UET3_9AGAR|nr:hypothetical protein BDP27DRAFT_1313530 [Rhodocollybia butyracea]